MIGEWYWVLLFTTAGASFLAGRWRGIREFEDAMIAAGKLDPRDG